VNLRTAKLLAKTFGILRELGEEVQETVQAPGGMDATDLRSAVTHMRMHLDGLVHRAAWHCDLPPGIKTHDIVWDKIPDDVEEVQCEASVGTIQDRLNGYIDRSKRMFEMLQKHGMPDGDFELIEWLDKKLSKGE